MIKYIKNLIMGIPVKGEPVIYTTKKYTTMPPGCNISMEEWENSDAWMQHTFNN